MVIEPMTATKIEFDNGLDLVEYAGRKCWKSEPKGNPEGFARNLMKRGHTSVLEHHSAEISADSDIYQAMTDKCSELGVTPTRVYSTDCNKSAYVSARTVFEITEDADMTIDFLKLKPSSVRPTYDIVCDRAVSHELVRHRVASFTQESQRYVNYSGGNHLPICGNELSDCLVGTDTTDDPVQTAYRYAISQAWEAYNMAIELGNDMREASLPIPQYALPQIARCILPNITRTTLVMSMFMWEWDWFFMLRRDVAAHPDMRVIANQIYADLGDRMKFWEDNRKYHNALRFGVPGFDMIKSGANND